MSSVGGVFDPALLDALEASARDTWEGEAWRQVVGTTDPLRPNVLGGRWNPPGVEALYCALSRRGAEVELTAVLDRQPVVVSRTRITHRLRVRLSRVVTVSEAEAFAAAGVSVAAVLHEGWTMPQRIGAAADWLGMSGLIVPSGRHDAGNLVILVNNLSSDDHYDVATDDGV